MAYVKFQIQPRGPFEAAHWTASKKCLVVDITPCLLGPERDSKEHCEQVYYRCLKTICAQCYKWQTKSFHLSSSKSASYIREQGLHRSRFSFSWVGRGIAFPSDSEQKRSWEQIKPACSAELVPAAVGWFSEAALPSCFHNTHLELFTWGQTFLVCFSTWLLVRYLS